MGHSIVLFDSRESKVHRSNQAVAVLKSGPQRGANRKFWTFRGRKPRYKIDRNTSKKVQSRTKIACEKV